MKKSLSTSDFFWRPVAESNRSKRFCRPLTKSLIQPAKNELSFEKRVQNYCFFLNYANFCAFLSVFFAYLRKKV